MAIDRTLIDETNKRFWTLAGYKPGQRLDMTDPKDRKMAAVWLAVHVEVRGHRDRATALAQAVYERAVLFGPEQQRGPLVLVIEKPDGSVSHLELRRQGDLDAHYLWTVGRPEQYRYVAAFDFVKNPGGPVRDRFSSMPAERPATAGWYAGVGY